MVMMSQEIIYASPVHDVAPTALWSSAPSLVTALWGPVNAPWAPGPAEAVEVNPSWALGSTQAIAALTYDASAAPSAAWTPTDFLVFSPSDAGTEAFVDPSMSCPTTTSPPAAAKTSGSKKSKPSPVKKGKPSPAKKSKRSLFMAKVAKAEKHHPVKVPGINFKSALKRVNERVNPGLSLGKKALASLNDMLGQCFKMLGSACAKEAMTAVDVQKSVRLNLAGDLQRHAIAEANRAVARAARSGRE